LNLKCDLRVSKFAFSNTFNKFQLVTLRLGIRAYIAPMLGDDLEGYSNYIPLARDAQGRNAAAKAAGCDCGAMCNGGFFRTAKGVRCPAKTQANIDLWTEAVEKFHDPEGGINIVVGLYTLNPFCP
jgi:hypothetical protein